MRITPSPKAAMKWHETAQSVLKADDSVFEQYSDALTCARKAFAQRSGAAESADDVDPAPRRSSGVTNYDTSEDESERDYSSDDDDDGSSGIFNSQFSQSQTEKLASPKCQFPTSPHFVPNAVRPSIPPSNQHQFLPLTFLPTMLISLLLSPRAPATETMAAADAPLFSLTCSLVHLPRTIAHIHQLAYTGNRFSNVG